MTGPFLCLAAAILCFLVAAFKGPLKFETSISFTDLGFAFAVLSLVVH